MKPPTSNDIKELAALVQPPAAVAAVLAAVLVLLGEAKPKDWNNAKRVLRQSGKDFIVQRTQELQVDSVPLYTAHKARAMVQDMTSESISRVSEACHYFYEWMIVILDKVEQKHSKKDTNLH